MGWRHFSPIPFSFQLCGVSPGSLNRNSHILLFTLKRLTHATSSLNDRSSVTEIKRRSSRERNAAWCVVDIEGKIFRARVIHVGRGRFLVIEDNQDSDFVDKIVDASNILGCELKA